MSKPSQFEFDEEVFAELSSLECPAFRGGELHNVIQLHKWYFRNIFKLWFRPMVIWKCLPCGEEWCAHCGRSMGVGLLDRLR